MPVSANTLFHFSDFKKVKNILQTGGFWPQYSLEYFNNVLPKTSNYSKAYIPMVCFCDLKLTQLSDTSISSHTKDFGAYGIGFKKTWGIRKGVSPVSYVHSKSITSQTIDVIVSEINVHPASEVNNIAPKLGEIVKFLEPYKGNHQKGKRKRKQINYYDEREWRYIPKGGKFKAFPYMNTTYKDINKLNIELRKKKLYFQPNDIKYLIIANENEKPKLARVINNLPKISKTNKIALISKIVSLKEIHEDF